MEQDQSCLCLAGCCLRLPCRKARPTAATSGSDGDGKPAISGGKTAEIGKRTIRTQSPAHIDRELLVEILRQTDCIGSSHPNTADG